MVWLDVDTTIRELSKGAKSIDDFCRLFFAGESGPPSVSAYTLDDVVAALNHIQPHDWAGFFRKRVQSVEARAPFEGLERSGWKLTYNNQRSDYWTAEEDQQKITDLTLSLGAVVKSDGAVQDVEMGGPAQKAGIAPGARITSVNGRQFTAGVLREAVQGSATGGDTLEFVVKNGDYFSTHNVEYRGGEKSPHLVRAAGKTDWLAEIIKGP